jgi:hypothetical protein
VTLALENVILNSESLKVYNLLVEEVVTLVDEKKQRVTMRFSGSLRDCREPCICTA